MIDLLLGSKLSIRWLRKIALCIFFLSVFLLFCSPFAVLLNCFYPNPQVLPFPSDSPPWLTMGDEWESNHMVLCCLLGQNHNMIYQEYHFTEAKESFPMFVQGYQYKCMLWMPCCPFLPQAPHWLKRCLFASCSGKRW